MNVALRNAIFMSHYIRKDRHPKDGGLAPAPRAKLSSGQPSSNNRRRHLTTYIYRAARASALPNLRHGHAAPAYHSPHRTPPTMTPVRTPTPKPTSPDTRNNPWRSHFRFPSSHQTSLLALILSNMSLGRCPICSLHACQKTFSECTIMYIIGRCALWPGEPV